MLSKIHSLPHQSSVLFRHVKPGKVPLMTPLFAKQTNTTTYFIKWISTERRLEIQGMKCSGCVNKVTKTLQDLPGSENVAVNLLTKSATAKINEEVSDSEIVQAIKDVGFEATMVQPPTTLTVNIDGMHCASCVTKVTDALNQLPNTHATVNLLSGTATIITNRPNHLRDIFSTIESLGYTPSLPTESSTSRLESHQKQEEEEYSSRLKQAGWFAIPAFIVSMVCGMWLKKPEILQKESIIPGITWNDAIMFSLATPMQFIVAKPFHISAIKSLKSGLLGANMDVLVSLGSFSAYFYSIALLGQGITTTTSIPKDSKPSHKHQNYFESSIFLITFILLGKWIEAKSKTHTSSSIRALASLQPQEAILVTKGATKIIPTELIQPEDVLQVAVGARFPADGKVVKGTSFVDESWLTGESLPKSISPSSKIMAGTINQGPEVVEMQAVKVGRESTIQHILGLVEDAQTKPPTQQLADKISGIFVPTVITLSILDLSFWLSITSCNPSWIPQGFTSLGWAINCAISTLVIACPCAIGLATPTALMVSTSLAAENGILTRGGGMVLESASKVKNIVWDKTGTLTQGIAKVVRVEGKKDEVMWDAVQSIQSKSTHPLSKSLVEWISQEYPSTSSNTSSIATNVQEVAGMGMIGKLNNKTIVIGNLQLMNRYNIPTSSLANVYIGTLDPNPRLFASIQISDIPRLEAKPTIDILSSMGISSWIVSGDSVEAVENVAKQLSIPSSHTIAQVDPEGKKSALDKISPPVAFVGDGINDSVVLAHADVGISLPTSEIAMDSAPVVLTRPNLLLVPTLISLSKATMQTIKRNFAWAFFYNLLCVPLAAGMHVAWLGWHGLDVNDSLILSPELAGLVMGLSSVSVVMSSLLLRRWKPLRL